MWRLVHRRGMATTAFKSFLEDRVMQFPTKAALRVTHQNIRWSLAALNDHSGATGCGLLDLGLRPQQDAVAVALRCTAEHVTLQLGAASAGLSVASVDDVSSLTPEGLRALVKDQKCAVLVVGPESIPTVYTAFPELQQLSMRDARALKLEGAPSLRFIYHTGNDARKGMHRFRDMLLYDAVPDRLQLLPELKPSEQRFLTVVDGKSGAASGASLSLQAWMDAGAQQAEALGMKAESRALFKAKGAGVVGKMAAAVAATVTRSAELVIPAANYDEDLIAKALEEDTCDVEIK